MKTSRPIRWSIALLGALLLVSTAAYADDPGFPAPTGDASLVSPDARLDRLFDGGCMLTEGVAAGHDGMVYFSDITFTAFCKDPSGQYLQAGNIWKYDPSAPGKPRSSAARPACRTASSSTATAT